MILSDTTSTGALKLKLKLSRILDKQQHSLAMIEPLSIKFLLQFLIKKEYCDIELF